MDVRHSLNAVRRLFLPYVHFLTFQFSSRSYDKVICGQQPLCFFSVQFLQCFQHIFAAPNGAENWECTVRRYEMLRSVSILLLHKPVLLFALLVSCLLSLALDWSGNVLPELSRIVLYAVCCFELISAIFWFASEICSFCSSQKTKRICCTSFQYFWLSIFKERFSSVSLVFSFTEAQRRGAFHQVPLFPLKMAFEILHNQKWL